MRQHWIGVFLIAGVGGFGQANARAQEPPQRTASSFIRTFGEASVQAKPDQAQIDIGVVTQAADAQAATAQNATQADAVLARLRGALGTDAEIKSVNYWLNPDYKYPKEGGGKPVISSYTATNIVRVTTGNLQQVGRIIDLATQFGANQIQRLQFTLKDDQAVHAQALQQAAQKARASAESMASSLGLKIARVLSLEEGAPVRVPVREMAMAASARAETPVEPGTIDVRAQVTLTVEVSP